MKLDIACGQNKQNGFTGIDIAKIDGVDIVHNLQSYPWPIKSDSVEEAFCSHYIEHIPAENVAGTNQDHLLKFFDELYRILKVGAKIRILAPYYSSIRCWQDPTHRRAISEYTFLYANKGWRVQNKLDHYPVQADFDFTYGYALDPEYAVRTTEVQTNAVKHYINAVSDIDVTMTKRAPEVLEEKSKSGRPAKVKGKRKRSR